LAPPGRSVVISGGTRRPVSLVGRLSEQTCSRPWGGARGTSAYDVAAAASSCCDVVAAVVTRDGSPIAAALAAVRGAIFKRRLVIMGIPNLSALAGVRAGTVGVTLSAKKRKSERPPLETEGTRGEMLLTSNWRIPASSSLRAGGYLCRTRWCLRGACRHLHGWPSGGRFRARYGYQFHGRLFGQWPAPHHYTPPHPTTSSPVPAEGRVPAARAAGTPCCTTSGAPAA
jgi:hypothetical protein